MREPKYRVWNTELKKMVYREDLEKAMHDLTQIDGVQGIFLPTNEKVKLMQFTGREDGLGNEVYEGDIVKVIDTYDNDREFIGVVFFRDCSFVIKNSTSSNYRWMDYEVYVLGNMFDDKELIEDYEIMEMVKKREQNDNGIRYSLEEIKSMFNV